MQTSVYRVRACLQGENVTVVLYLITRVNLTSFTEVFCHAWPHKTKITIICDVQDLRENLKFSVENTLNS